jgi:hypothetical protein
LILCVTSNLGAAIREDVIEQIAPDDFADRARCGVVQRVLGIAHVEQERLRVRAAKLHHDLDVDDILVARQHAGAVLEALGRPRVDDLAVLDGPRPMPLPAGLRELLECAEAELEAALGGIDAIETEASPDEHQNYERARREPATKALLAAAARAAAATKYSRQLSLQVAHYRIEIRRTFVLVRSPRITFIAIIPSHRASHFLSNTVG